MTSSKYRPIYFPELNKSLILHVGEEKNKTVFVVFLHIFKLLSHYFDYLNFI